MDPALLDDLQDWLAIPSVSTEDGFADELEKAAEWAADRIRAAGGTVELVRIDGGHPLVIGDLPAADPDAPTVMIYGHYDVQGEGDRALWTSPAFEPTIREGRIYARGAADDKGNFLPLLHVACALARDGALPVNVRVVCEGEEEAGSTAVSKWLAADERGADAAIVFDSGMADPETPAVTIGLRGIVMADLRVRGAQRDLHSGIYSPLALNALHATTQMLAAVLPGPDGRDPEALRVGIVEAADAERESWKILPNGDEVLAEAGARPAFAGAGAAYYERNGADSALSVNHISGGAPRTVIPATVDLTVSVRLAPRQDPDVIRTALERLLRDALPAGAELEVLRIQAGPAALFDVDLPAIRIAGEALGRAAGHGRCAFVRSGGSIPIVADLAAKGIPTIVSGSTLPDDVIHAPDESIGLSSLDFGERASRELLQALAAL